MSNSTPSFARHAFWGVAFMAVSLVATKLSALLAQFALGWLLTSNDYKVWGMLLSLRMLVDGLRNGGVIPVMQQRGLAALEEETSYAQYALFFNLLAAVILLALIGAAEKYFRTTDLAWLIVLLAIHIPLQTLSAIHRARLSIHLRFAALAKYASIAAFVGYVAMVTFAALKMGPYCFVLSLSVTATVEWWLFRRAAGPLTQYSPLSPQQFAGILRVGRWVMCSAALASIAMMGDYFVIGRIAPDLLGDYLFGFQLTVAVSTVVVAGFQQVMLPTFSRLQNDPRRMADAFTKSMRLTAFLCAPCFAAVSLLAPSIVHFLWAGKWDRSIPVVQVMSLCLVFRLLNPLAITVLQVTGRWNVYAKILVLDAASIVTAATIGAQSENLATLALCVGIGRCVAVPVLVSAACATIGVSRRSLAIAVVQRVGLPVAGVLLYWWIGGFPGLTRPIDTVAAGVTLALTVFPLPWLFRSDVQLLRRMLFRSPSSPPKDLMPES